MEYKLNISYTFNCPDDTSLGKIITKLEEMKNLGELILEKEDDFNDITKSSNIAISEDIAFGEYTGHTNTYYYSPRSANPVI